MSEESGCFDPNAMIAAKSTEPQKQHHISNSESHSSFGENLSLSVEDLPYKYYGEDTIIATTTTTTTMEIIQQPQQMENPYIHSNNNNFNIIEEVNNNNHVPFYHQFYYPTFENSSHSFENTTHNTNTLTSLQHAFTTMTQPTRNDFVFGDENLVAAYQDFGNEVVMEEDFNQQEVEVTQTNVGRRRRGGRRNLNNSPENKGAERQKRVELNGKFDVLKDLIPNPTRNDRATVVGDAIEYIRELQRTVLALKSLVKDKSQEKQRMIKRLKVEKGELEDNDSLTNTWIQRKSNDTEVDVRIIDDEVTIKLVQTKKINCLVSVSRVLDEFKLLLQHLASGNIGDLYSFFISSKICEGSSVNATAIANKLIAVLDISLAAAA